MIVKHFLSSVQVLFIKVSYLNNYIFFPVELLHSDEMFNEHNKIIQELVFLVLPGMLPAYAEQDYRAHSTGSP